MSSGYQGKEGENGGEVVFFSFFPDFWRALMFQGSPFSLPSGIGPQDASVFLLVSIENPEQGTESQDHAQLCFPGIEWFGSGKVALRWLS